MPFFAKYILLWCPTMLRRTGLESECNEELSSGWEHKRRSYSEALFPPTPITCLHSHFIQTHLGKCSHLDYQLLQKSGELGQVPTKVVLTFCQPHGETGPSVHHNTIDSTIVICWLLKMNGRLVILPLIIPFVCCLVCLVRMISASRSLLELYSRIY